MKIQISTTNIMKAQAMFKKVAVFAVSAVFFFCIANVAQAQDRIYKPFRFGLGGGYAFLGSSEYEDLDGGTKFSGAKGVSFWFEPQYAINDNIGVGLRWQGFFMAATERESGGKTADVVGDASLLSVISLHGDYFFVNSHPWRMSGGLGVGLYRQASFGALEASSGVGIVPRVRGQILFFELGLAYHLTFAPEVYNYLALDLGFQIGGSRYDK